MNVVFSNFDRKLEKRSWTRGEARRPFYVCGTAGLLSRIRDMTRDRTRDRIKDENKESLFHGGQRSGNKDFFHIE